MTDNAKLTLGDETIDLPVIVGSENEHAIDISKLRAQTGYITLDVGYGNTGACQSAITYIDGDKGILRYRGIPIEQLAEHSSFLEVAYLLIWGKLPNATELADFSELMTEPSFLREQLRHHFEWFPPGSPPMAVLSAVLNSMACFYPELLEAEDVDVFQEEPFGLELRATHVPKHLFTAIEGCAGRRDVDVIGQLLLACESAEAELGRVERCCEFMGKPSCQRADCTQAVDPGTTLAEKRELHLQRVQGAGQPGGQDPEDERNE